MLSKLTCGCSSQPAGHPTDVVMTTSCLCPPGEVFHSAVPGRLSLSSASDRCVSLGGQLATAGQLYLAWKDGLDSCAPGWLSDGSVRYPVTRPRPDCAGRQPGVHTVAPNSTEDNSTALYDAYCYRGKLGLISYAAVVSKTIPSTNSINTSNKNFNIQIT